MILTAEEDLLRNLRKNRKGNEKNSKRRLTLERFDTFKRRSNKAYGRKRRNLQSRT